MLGKDGRAGKSYKCVHYARAGRLLGDAAELQVLSDLAPYMNFRVVAFVPAIKTTSTPYDDDAITIQ